MVKKPESEKISYRNPEALNEPKVSIIIVTYNAGLYLENCINSIISQQNKDYELLIFDGESNDNTISIIQKKQENISYWQSEKDKGIYDAMNKALEFVRGKWVFFLGADDLLFNEFSEMLSMLNKPKALYYGNCMIDDQLFGKKYSNYHISKINYCHQAIFYPAFIFNKYKYETKYKVYADYALNILCWGDNTIEKIYIPKNISNYKLGGFSNNNNNKSTDLFKLEKPQWIKKHLGKTVYLRYCYRKWKAKIRTEQDFF